MAQTYDPFRAPQYIWKTSRARKLRGLRAVYEGTQYDGRPDWWTGGPNCAPLRERKPCVIYRLPKASCSQVSKFLWGEGRFPALQVGKTEANGSEEDGQVRLSEDDAKTLGTWLPELIESAGVKSAIRSTSEQAIAIGSCVVVAKLIEGQFQFSLLNPEDCWAEFRNGNLLGDVTRLLICYQFDKEVVDEQGKPIIKRHVFRQEWDETNVYTWDDVPLPPDEKIQWPGATAAPHGLTFCPVIWFRNEPLTSGVDGHSLIDGQEDEFEALDMTLSKRHQGIIYLGAPQPVETGVAEGDGPGATKRTAVQMVEAGGNTFGPKYGQAEGRPARAAGPNVTWRYEGKDVSVKLIETTGKAFEVGTLHVTDIRSRILETIGVVLTSMTDTISRVSTGAEMSARFLQLAHAPLIALVEEYRPVWWHHGLKRLVSMCCRIAVDVYSQNQSIAIPGTAAAVKVLARCYSERDGAKVWNLFRIEPKWGDFFTPSSTEIKTDVDAAAVAVEKRLVSPKTGTTYISHSFNIESIEEERREIDEQAKLDAEAEEDADRRAISKLHEGIGGDETSGAASKRGSGSGSSADDEAESSAPRSSESQ